MTPQGRLGVGRVLAVGLGQWLRRFLPIHVVAAICLAPLVLVSGDRDLTADGTIFGLLGLTPTAWVVAAGLMMPFENDIARNTALAYLAQLAVATLVLRDVHRRLARRRVRSGPRGLLGLVAFAAAGLAAFVALSFAVTAGLRETGSPLAGFGAVVAVSFAQAVLASWFCLTLPAAAVDGSGFLAALARSRRLGRGSRFRVVVPLLLLVVLQGACAILIASLEGEPWLLAVPAVLFLTIKASVLAATYREICLLMEGIPPDEIGAVFA